MDIRIKKIKDGYHIETKSSSKTYKYASDALDAIYDIFDAEIEISVLEEEEEPSAEKLESLRSLFVDC